MSDGWKEALKIASWSGISGNVYDPGASDRENRAAYEEEMARCARGIIAEKLGLPPEAVTGRGGWAFVHTTSVETTVHLCQAGKGSAEAAAMNSGNSIGFKGVPCCSSCLNHEVISVEGLLRRGLRRP